jgi:2-desacetyl-2-hydroxyethyl bacteriochlorophyllide A dehydrogenase
MKAEAVIFLQKNKVRFQEIEVPDPSPKDVVVHTKYSWISTGTERSYLRGERANGEVPCTENAQPPFPIVPGYQKVGIVQSVGEDVHGIQPGEWVFVSHSYVSMGPWKVGGHVSLAVAPTEWIWKIPEGVDPVMLSGLVLVQVGYNCATRPPVEKGDIAVVIGDGLVGQWSAQVLAYRGARTILVGRHAFRLEHLRVNNGATVNVKKEDLVNRLHRLSYPQKIAVLVDAIGSVPIIESILPLMRHNGHIVSAGFCGTEGLIDIQMLRYGELTLHCPSGISRNRMDQTLELIAKGVIDTKSLITHRFPADQAEKAWNLILNYKEEFLGIILEWD